MAARTCRVIVNQAHCFATGGFFDNGMPFSLSMGCGAGEHSIDGNLNWEHFINKVRIVRVIKENKPELEDIFTGFGKRRINDGSASETLKEQVDRNAQMRGDTVWLISPENGEEVSFAQAQTRIVEIAARLSGLGFEEGASVAIAAPIRSVPV